MILALDIGTTELKAALFAREPARGAGGAVCLAQGSAPVRALRSENPVWHEIRAEAWLDALRRLIPATLAAARDAACARTDRRASGSPDRVLDAVVVSGNGPTLLPLDAEGRPLAPALTWMDRRAVDEAILAGAAADRVLDPMYNLPKALWIMRHRPALYDSTARFSSCPEFICGALTGEWRSFLPADGFQAIIWDEGSIGALGLDIGKFPPFIGLGEVLGRVHARAAAEFGLPAGAPVVSGGPDFIAALIGTATTHPGRACDRAGTSEGINLCHSGNFRDDPRLLVMPHVIRPHSNISGVISTTGRAVDWFGREIARYRETGLAFADAATAAPGADRLLFLPYLSGERAPLWDPDARGAFIGLTLNHGRAQMARAVLESAAFAMRDVIETMEELGGRVTDLRATGKPSTSGFWNRIKADITQKPLLVPAFPHAELVGDLCFALVALGDFAHPEDAAERCVSMAGTFEPDPRHAAAYDGLFAAYREAYRALKPVFGALARKED